MSRIGNQVTQSLDFGGGVVVFGGVQIQPAILGGAIAATDMPSVGNVLPAGTPVKCEEGDKITPCYQFKVYAKAESSATTIKLAKGAEGTRVKVGMILGVAPKDVDTATTGISVTAVNTENADYDEITVASLSGAINKDTIMVEVDAAGASAKIKVKPNALLMNDEELPAYGNCNAIYADAAYALLDGEVYANRIPAICDAVKAYMASQGCVFRYTNVE